MHKSILELTKSVHFLYDSTLGNLHKYLQHKYNGIPFRSSKPIPCVQTDARTGSDINRCSAGMRTHLKGQAFNCVRLQTLNGT